ncbi:hypothetical protein KO507_10725 [Gilvimarinus agarilyticus]|uniref:hypothetical protein n=1 Tax=unclassified Gilvimarinus TaxID=2642066 RepID=UPI001C091A97|nr:MULTISPECIES: hypothetical protein [unclassified Gilvimarinus]MBU2886236.1 hypothetical protein [Gilvimarinus agarilyticus]MDO6570924.1 hypothetical protein [Gilvimarinus sp. 2_MG-2023]MDO6747789.1 hypothetical protein [Gilvimarinus sp. 1_MG-2023]
MRCLTIVALALILAGCGGNDDPLLNVINDPLDIEFEDFYVDRTDIYPGESVWIEWQAEGALYFDARLYVSQDERISQDDLVVIDEECGVESDDHCTADEDIYFSCHYDSSNRFSCREGGDILKRTDLTPLIEQYPQEAYLILELCNDNCEERSWPLLFR